MHPTNYRTTPDASGRGLESHSAAAGRESAASRRSEQVSLRDRCGHPEPLPRRLSRQTISSVEPGAVMLVSPRAGPRTGVQLDPDCLGRLRGPSLDTSPGSSVGQQLDEECSVGDGAEARPSWTASTLSPSVLNLQGGRSHDCGCLRRALEERFEQHRGRETQRGGAIGWWLRSHRRETTRPGLPLAVVVDEPACVCPSKFDVPEAVWVALGG